MEPADKDACARIVREKKGSGISSLVYVRVRCGLLLAEIKFNTFGSTKERDLRHTRITFYHINTTHSKLSPLSLNIASIENRKIYSSIVIKMLAMINLASSKHCGRKTSQTGGPSLYPSPRTKWPPH